MPEGIRFAETMSGPFAMGATHCEQGAQLGRRQGSELSLQVDIDISNLGGFIGNRSQAGELRGQISHPELRGAAPASSGRFQLFAPGSDAQTRYMVYELVFECAGQPYFISGRKHVRDDPGFDMWKDTTTLHTTLHQGTDGSGPVAGAGILSLGVKELLGMLATLRATGEGDAATVLRFGSFFFGQLWDVYGPHWKAGEGRE